MATHHQLLFAASALLACAPPHSDDDSSGDSAGSESGGDSDGEVVRAMIGPDGGVVEGLGIALDIPAGALDEMVEIVVRTEAVAEIEGVAALSPRYRFEPEGLHFAATVAVRVELDDPAFGTLYWSRADDPTRFERAGVAAGGIAEGYTAHFSSAFVGNGACTDPSGAGESSCNCRAGDEIEDALCPVDPSNNEGMCPDMDGYAGSNGNSCSGYGPRYETTYICACYSSQGNYLCPDAHVLGPPMQYCPSEGGLNGFESEEPMGSCSGTTVVFDPQTGEGMNKSESGELVMCNEVYGEVEFESVSGTLEGCIGSRDGDADGAACAIQGSDGSSGSGISKTCQTRVEGKGRNTACPLPQGQESIWHALIGTEIGNMIETQRWADGKTRLRQVMVPFGSKSECNEEIPDNRTSPGFLDMVEIVARDEATKEVRIRIAEIKPMSRGGLADGPRDLGCYAKRIDEAGLKCPMITLDSDPPALTEYVDFCHTFDAFGWRVRLDDQPYLFRQPGLEEHVPHTFTTAPGNMTKLTIMTCENGLVTYQCEE